MLESIGVVNLGTYLIGAALIIVLPGPNSLYVLATAASQNLKEGYKAASGIFVGDTILLVLAAGGAASVLKALPVLFYTLKVVGACYLAYLGVRILWSLYKPAPVFDHQRLSTVKKPTESRFLKALTLSLMNLKPLCFCCRFWCSLLIQPKAIPGWLSWC